VQAEPKERLVAADQAIAKSLLLTRADLAAGFKASKPDPETEGPQCKALDESDLTVTGNAESPVFTTQDPVLVRVSSFAMLYRTAAEASTSWRRGTSEAGFRCAASYFKRSFNDGTTRFGSLRWIPFPHVAPRTIALRLRFSVMQNGQWFPVVLDVVVLQRGRMQTEVVFARAGRPVSSAEREAVARLLAGRLAGAAPTA